MDFPEPNDVVEQPFAEFMADQGARLSPESYPQYAGIIALFDLYPDRYYRPECSRREEDAPARPDGRFRGFPPAVDLVRRFSVFLDDFLPREIEDGVERLRAARKVIKTLGAWLAAKGYVVRNEAARGRSEGRERPPYFPGFFQDWPAEAGPDDHGERRSAGSPFGEPGAGRSSGPELAPRRHLNRAPRQECPSPDAYRTTTSCRRVHDRPALQAPTQVRRGDRLPP